MSGFAEIIFTLFILWVLSYFVFHIAGFLIHLLIIVAVVMILVRVIQGKNPFK